MLKSIGAWIKNARNIALPQSLLPAFLAFALARHGDDFSWWIGILSVLGVACAHLGLNLFDDYFDYRHKGPSIRDELAAQSFRARIGKCDYLTNGSTTIGQLLMASCAFSGVALIIGVTIAMLRGETILYIALAAAVLGISYSAPPLKFSYRGLGDLMIGFIFGPLLMSGVYHAASGEWSNDIFYISVPVGLLVANIVYSHSILDYIPDKAVGKKTFAVWLDNSQSRLVASFFILFSPFAILFSGMWFGHISWLYALAFATLPLAVVLFYLLIQFVKHPDRVFTPKFYMGPMADWQRICDAGLDWFMIRWLIARNLISFFCLIIIIVSFFV